MTAGEERDLLRADEERLRGVAASLARGGRLGVVVAEGALWGATRRFLTSVMPSWRFEDLTLESADDATRAFRHEARALKGVVLVLHLSARAVEAYDALNLRREDLRRTAASHVIRLAGSEAHHEFMVRAPDCYAYRDTLAVVEGEPTFEFPLRFREEALGAERSAAALLDRRARIRHLWRAADSWYQGGPVECAHRDIDEILSLWEQRPAIVEADRFELAETLMFRTRNASLSERYRLGRRALALVEPVADASPDRYRVLRAQVPDALGCDLKVAREAADRLGEDTGESALFVRVHVAQAWRVRDAFAQARESLERANDHRNSGYLYGVQVVQRVDLLLAEGRWDEALALLHGKPSLATNARLAKLMLLRGELRAARRILDAAPKDDRVRLMRAEVLGESGDFTAAFEALDDLDAHPGELGVDALLATARLRVALVERSIGAGERPLDARGALDERLVALHERILATEGLDPPWPAIWVQELRADSLLWRRGVERDALRHTDNALRLAREGATELIPQVARRAITAHLRLGELDEAAARLREAEAAAREHEHAGELARLRGLALWHASLAAGDLAQAEAAMLDAVRATGSPLVEAAVLHHAGAAIGRRDLIERAREIYRSLPWPAREGECFEALGRVEVARVRYRSYGLVLRERAQQSRDVAPPVVADCG